MTALANERQGSTEVWTHKEFTLTSGTKAWKGAKLFLVPTTGKVVPATIAQGLAGAICVGTAMRTIDATAADKTINVHLERDVPITRWENDTVAPVAATDVGKLCYFKDDQTVSITPTGAVAGRIWGYDASYGIAVEQLTAALTDGIGGTATAFAANDSIIPSNPLSGSILDIPATAGASTVTLPATAREGTIINFVADGVKNGHTVTYRDATGLVSLTTALIASKRHQVRAIFLNSKWSCIAYTAP